MRKIIDILTPNQLSNIIIVIEQGLELEQLKYPATKDPECLSRITDTCLFLSSLYIRKLDVDGSSGEFPNSCC